MFRKIEKVAVCVIILGLVAVFVYFKKTGHDLQGCKKDLGDLESLRAFNPSACFNEFDIKAAAYREVSTKCGLGYTLTITNSPEINGENDELIYLTDDFLNVQISSFPDINVAKYLGNAYIDHFVCRTNQNGYPKEYLCNNEKVKTLFNHYFSANHVSAKSISSGYIAKFIYYSNGNYLKIVSKNKSPIESSKKASASLSCIKNQLFKN